MDAISNQKKEYILDLDKLMPGDIILEHGYKIHSLAIMEATKSHYSHAMLYEGSTIIEATNGGGVFSKVPNRFAVAQKKDLKVLRLKENISIELLEDIARHSRIQVGSSYSKSEAYKVIKKVKPSKKTGSGQFCSRLVAQCYNHFGIKLVENVDYCSPADIEKSELLYEVPDAVKKASPQELKHALEVSIHTKHLENTNKWIKESKKILQKSGEVANDVNGIFHAIMKLKNPKLDKKILKVINSTGYYEYYLKDKEVNPYRYDIAEFSNKTQDNEDVIDAEIHKEISIVKTHSINLENTRANYKAYQSVLLKAELTLYKNLLEITAERLNIITTHCESRNLQPKLLQEAYNMLSYIKSAI